MNTTEYTTRNWQSPGLITLKQGDTLHDTERGDRVEVNHFYKHERWGWMLVLRNGVEIEMGWVSPRLGDTIRVLRGDDLIVGID